MKKTPVVIIAALAVLGFILFSLFNAPVNGTREPEQFVIRKNESIRKIADRLENERLIRSGFFFFTLVRGTGKARSIKTGEYILHDGMSTTSIIKMFARGEVALERVTIPEGFTAAQIARLLEDKGMVKAEEFIRAASDQDLLNKYRIPFSSAEGFLFPDTYVAAKDLSAQQLAEIMIKKFFVKLTEIPFSGYTQEELRKIVIMASIVEKEAKLDSERELVAAVFYNRLKMGKRLESCATVQYVLGKPKERLLFSDLKVESPYNTYLHTGLPPGPISNPGLKSLAAAVRPARVDYLFFVSKEDGSHYFSSTYQEHLRAIQKFNHSGRIDHQLS